MSKISQYCANMALLGMTVIASGRILFPLPFGVKIGLTCLSLVLLVWIGIASRTLLRKDYICILLLNVLFIMATLYFYSAWGSALFFIHILIGCFVFNNLVLSRQMYCWVHSICFVVILVYVLTLNISTIDHTVAYNRYGDLINSNTVGILVLTGVLHGACWASVWRHKLCRYILFCLCLVCGGVLISRFHCRSALLMFGLFWLIFIVRKHPIAENTCSWITRFILLVSLLFPCVYVYLYTHTNLNLEIFGKNLFTGRQFVWRDTFHYILQNPLLGVGNEGLLEMGNSFHAARLTDATHNVMLGIWKSLGLVPFISFWWLLCHKGHYKGRPIIVWAAQLAFLTSLLGTYFENSYTNPGYGTLFLLLLLMKIKPDNSAKPVQNKIVGSR